MSFIISERLLETLQCSECCMYLNIFPLTVYPERKIRCGRCYDPKNFIGMTCEDIYTRGLFRCVNRFEGCSQMLFAKDVKQHETICKSKSFKCPICRHFSATPLQLVSHFQQIHPSQFLQNPDFQVQLNQESQQFWLYQMENFLFYFSSTVKLYNREVRINVANLGPVERAKQIKVLIQVYQENTLRLGSDVIACSSELLESEAFVIAIPDFYTRSVTCKINIELGDAVPMLILPPLTSTQFRYPADFPAELKGQSSAYSMSSAATFDSHSSVNLTPSKNKSMMMEPSLVDEEVGSRRYYSEKTDFASQTDLLEPSRDDSSDESDTEQIGSFEQNADSPKIHLTGEFIKRYPGYRLSLDGTTVLGPKPFRMAISPICPYCKLLMATSQMVYICSNGKHWICGRCIDFKRRCIEGISYNKKSQLLNFFREMKYYCKWNCGFFFNSSELETHETHCRDLVAN